MEARQLLRRKLSCASPIAQCIDFDCKGFSVESCLVPVLPSLASKPFTGRLRETAGRGARSQGTACRRLLLKQRKERYFAVDAFSHKKTSCILGGD